MTAKPLTDRTIKALKPASKPYIRFDSIVPALGVRMMPSAHRTFVLVKRFPGSRHPVPCALGVFTLREARAKARAWLELIEQGIDPRLQQERQRQENERRQQNTFAVVAEAFIAEKLPGERKGKEVESDIRRELIPIWGSRPVTDITARDVRDLVRAKRRTAPAQARNLLGTIKRLFAWAVDEDVYGLLVSPAIALKPSKIIGDKKTGTRILTDVELFALWHAAERMPYPHGPVYQLLMLDALRLNEVADATWSEFDFEKEEWVIPAERMKGKTGKARPHAVPLTADTLAILKRLPQQPNGEFLFSTTLGKSPVWMTSKVKERIDARMLRTLRALARLRGDDPQKVKLPPWVNHDIRRTVRTNLSRLKVTEEAREAVMAHARPGIKGVYDLYGYFDEKREALELWAARLRAIVKPPPANVITMRAAH